MKTHRDGWLFTPTASWASCIGMLALGMLLAVYGPATESFKERFDLSDASVGVALGAQSAGAVAGTLVVQRILIKFGGRVAIGFSYCLVVVGAVVIAAAPSWTLLVCAALVTGFGLGGADSVTSQLFAVGHGMQGARRLTIAHAFFGAGTVMAPVTVALIGGGDPRVAFVLVVVLAVVPLIWLRGIPGSETVTAPVTGRRPSRRAVWVLLVFTMLFLTHFAVQSGIGSWEPTRLVDLGFEASTAGLATSGFWLAMVIGRVVAAPLTDRVALATIVSVSCVGLVVSVAVAFVPGTTIWAYIAAGFFIGPIFPCGLSWLQQSGATGAAAFSYVIAGAMVGAAIAPVLVGWFIDGAGSVALAPVLFVGTILVSASAFAARQALARPL